jgi:hypothetical protein
MRLFPRSEPVLRNWTRDVQLATGRVARCTWMRMPNKIKSDTTVSGWVTIPHWLTEGEFAEVRLALESDPLVTKVIRDPVKRVA